MAVTNEAKAIRPLGETASETFGVEGPLGMQARTGCEKNSR
jgi:hypothetical protein